MTACTAYHSNETKAITLTNSASTSPIVDVAGYKFLVAYLDSGFGATSITLHAALNADATFYPAYDGASAISTGVGASRAVRLDVEAFNVVRLVLNSGSEDITFSLQAS